MARKPLLRLWQWQSEIDTKSRQLGLMRETNRKPLEPPAKIIDPTTIIHESRAQERCGIRDYATCG